MGQKVNPYGFRLGITTDWKSRWFATREEYRDFVIEDWQIRKYLMDELPHAAISRIEVERTRDRLRIDVHTARPGIVIGRKGEASLDVSFPGRHQSRTVVQGTVEVKSDQLGLGDVGGYESYNLMLNGEILAAGALFESFRYKYDLPRDEVTTDRLPLVFQRYLRPGIYDLILKLEDINQGSFQRLEYALDVPKVEHAEPPAETDPETARILAEANAVIRFGERTMKIAPLAGGWQTGLVRIDALTTGPELAKVIFLLDDRPILTKKVPPWTVELDLGQVPRPRVLRIEGYDQEAEMVSWDERMLNAGAHRFAVRLIEPRKGRRYQRSLRAEAEVIVPEGELVDRVEFFLNDDRVATVYQPPYLQPIVLPGGDDVAYVRALAFAPDGRSAEDLVFINAPDNLEEIDVDFVELYTTVLNQQGHPVDGLRQEAFTVLEDGVPQELMRFEIVRDLPIHVAIMLDVSASMEERIANATTAAVSFFEQTVTPKDRAAIITFNDHPSLAAKFSNDPLKLAGGLAGLKAERGTALWDSLVFSLYYFNGIKGQRAILLLSDGKDESSRFSWDDALEYARRAGVSIYTIGLDLPRRELESRNRLRQLADATGGRTFFIEDVLELDAIYALIQRELRSRYLLAYQSSNTTGSTRFRRIQVAMAGGNLEPKTVQGYYPD